MIKREFEAVAKRQNFFLSLMAKRGVSTVNKLLRQTYRRGIWAFRTTKLHAVHQRFAHLWR